MRRFNNKLGLRHEGYQIELKIQITSNKANK